MWWNFYMNTPWSLVIVDFKICLKGKVIEYQLTNNPVVRVKDLDKAVLEICFAESDSGWIVRMNGFKLVFKSPHDFRDQNFITLQRTSISLKAMRNLKC